MIRIPYPEAKETILKICSDAMDGQFPTRDSFIRMLKANPHVAVQGYNRFGIIFYWNDASACIYGHSETDAFGQDLVELLLPEEMQRMARDVITSGTKTGKMPSAGACDLIRKNGEYVSVFSGHLIFQWEDSTGPEFYCIDLAIDINHIPEMI